jgi:T5SS/PEP-CTERM-associated repeat protein
VLVTGTGSAWTNTVNLYVGSEGYSNSLVISDGGLVSSGGGDIGLSPTAYNNTVLVEGSGSTWTNSSSLKIGNQGSGNRLVISNQATVYNSDAYIGSLGSATNNSVLVTGTGSTWNNGSGLYVGNGGASNSLTISNEATVVSSNGYIGKFSTASNNIVTVTGTNSAWTNRSDLYIGYYGSSNSLVISDGGSVVNSNGYIGTANTSSNNSVLVTGTGSAWTNTGDLYFGNGGSSNSLVISNGASVINTYGYIGTANTSSNNSVLVTGVGSAWTNTGNLNVGLYGSSNSLVISDGGSVVNSSGLIGGNSSNNIVLVTGTGSAWTNTGDLYFGNGGSSNSLVISNGASVINTYGYIGTANTSSNNSVLVTGTGSAWSNSVQLRVGYQGSGNNLVITNGGSVVNSDGYIGYTTNSSNNSVMVTGTNSAWTNTGDLYVGVDGTSNSLVISNGASVVNSTGVIGYTTNSSNNIVVVTGTNSALTNTGDLYVGFYSRSSNTLTVANGGSVSATSLTIASQTGSSGTVNIGSLGGSDTAGSFGATPITFGAGTGTLNFNQSDTLTLSQSITGNTGTNFVSQRGSGVTILSGANSYNGKTTILAGTLRAGSTNALGRSSLYLGNSNSTGTLALGTNLTIASLDWHTNGIISLNPGSQALSISGSMTNSGGGGTFNFGGSTNTSTNTVLNFNSQSGFTTNSFSVLGSTDWSFSFVDNFISGYASSLLAWYTGTGSGLVVTGSYVVTNAQTYSSITFGADSQLIITSTGDATVTTAMVVDNSSTVSINGTLTTPTLTLNLGSRVQGTGTLNGSLEVNGTLAPGNSPGTFFLAGGNLTMGAGSTWDQEIFSTSVFDVVNVTGGTALLNGTMNITPTAGGSLQYGNQYNFLTADGGITGTFSSIVAPSGYRGRLINSGTVAGILVAPSSYTLVAQSPNQARVAGALDGFISATSGDRLTVSTALDRLGAGAYSSAFEQMMPSIYSSLPTLAFNTANALNTKLFERIWLMQVAGLSGAAVAGDSPTQNNDNNPLGLKADQNWSPFVDANGIFASANSGGALDTYNAQNGGVTTGGMYKFLPNLMAGGYAGYQYTHAGYDGSTSMEDNAARFGLLASWAGDTCYRNTDNIYLNGLVGGQMHNYNVDRQIVFSDINRTANATPTGGELDSAVQVGYNIREGGFTFGPQASLQYTYLGVGSFNESGADSLDLSVDSFNSSSMMFTLGGQGAYRIEVDEDFAVIPMADASWQHECLQNSYGIQSAFATGGPSESFNFQSSAPLRDFFYGGVGVGFAIGQNWQVSVLWNASAANADLASQNVYISAAARF